MMFNATFNNISAISWLLVLLVEETGVHNIVLSKPRHTITITSCADIIVCLILFHYIGNIASNGTASNSSVYYWKDIDQNMTAHFIVLHSPLRGGC